MRVVARIGLIVALMAVGCAGPQPASPTQSTSDPSEALYAENRGGPDLVLAVGSAPGVPLPCGASVVLRPGEAGAPDLPWDFQVRRADSGKAVLTQEVDALPRWFVQIGDQIVGGGLQPGPIEGPPGPPCGG